MRRIQLFKYRAKKLQVPFDLTIPFLLGLWAEQEGCCAVTGVKFEAAGIGVGKRNPFGPSLDRKDSAQGYTQLNVQWVSNIVNYGKNEWGEDAFKKMVKAAAARL